MAGAGMTELLGEVAADQLPDHDPARNHREVSGQTTLTAEMTKHRVVVGDELQKDLGTEVFDIVGLEAKTASVGGVVDDVVNQAHEPIDKIGPCARLVLQTTLEQLSIDFGQGQSEPSPL